jgi:hypothetical protein
MTDKNQPSSQGRDWRKPRARLLKRFPGVYHPSLVDKDFDQLTSDRTAHQPQRVFFLGEVIWTDRQVLSIPLRPGYQQVGHAPALVTRKQPAAHAPVEMAPVTRQWPDESKPHLFCPADPMPEMKHLPVFDLLYRRPVARPALSAHLATLSGADKQTLSRTLQKLSRP